MELRILDLGSNSFQLQRLRIDERGLATAARVRRFFKLGARIEENGRFSLETIEAAAATVGDMLAEDPSDSPIVGVATAAARKASNGALFVAEIEDRFGVPSSILSGEREAEYAFLGAWAGLDHQSTGRIAVVDIGGGSTEIAVGTRSHLAEQTSLPLGALDLRLGPGASGAHVGDPARQAVEDAIDRTLAGTAIQVHVGKVVFASGSARAVRDAVAGIRGLSAQDPARDEFTLRELCEMSEGMAGLDADALASLGCPPERTNVVRETALLMARIVELCGAERAVVVSTGVREGVAIRFYEESRAWWARRASELSERFSRLAVGVR